MKFSAVLELALVISGVAVSRPAFGQASFVFRNLNGDGNVNAPVFDAAGVPLAGTNYRAELYGGATPDSLTPLVLIDHASSRLVKTFATDGYVTPLDGGYLVVSAVPPGGWAWLQMRAWDARLGPTYEDATSLQIGGYGESSIFYAKGNDPFREPPEPGAPLIGLQSFSLRAEVPEPSTYTLLVCGGLALWQATRRKGLAGAVKRAFHVSYEIASAGRRNYPLAVTRIFQ